MATLTPEQAEEYKALCRKYEAQIIYGYCNAELDELMQLPNYAEELKQLHKEHFKAIRRYRTVREDHRCGITENIIRSIEEAESELRLLHNRELNARWLVKDNKTGLFWSRIIEPPYWGRSNKAFMFRSQEDALLWVKKFNRAANSNRRFTAAKFDATKRLANG